MHRLRYKQSSSLESSQGRLQTASEVMVIVIVVINPWLRTQTWDLQHRGQRSVSRMLDLELNESLPLLLPLPQLDVDGVHNEALPLELDAISPYQIMKLELFGTDWKPFACDAKSAHTCRGGGFTSSYSQSFPNLCWM